MNNGGRTGKKIVIVGGVAGGATAAARLRRLDERAEIILIERGPEVSFANCGLPYYVGDIIQQRAKLLVQTPRRLFQRYNIEVRILSEVTQIFPREKEVEILNLSSREVYRETYDYLVLSPGAKPIVPDIPGIDLPNVFTVRSLADSDRIREALERGKPSKALVIGGGFIGLEMVDNLRRRGLSVTIVEAANQVMVPLDFEMAAIVREHLKKNGVDIRIQCRVTALEGDGCVRWAVLERGERLETDMVIVAIGTAPESGLARKAGLNIGHTGGILVDDHLRTSDSNIYALGDAIQVKHFVAGQDALIPLAGPANRQARIVADNIAGRLTRYHGSQGTAIVKVLGLVVATTGPNEKTLKRIGKAHLSCFLHPASHATYYPGAGNLAMKLLFTPGEGKVLGAQIVGNEGVDKRIDVIATAIRAGMTVYDLQDLELAYAPPFSSAKDPVNMAGYASSNILNGDNSPCYWDELADLDPQKSLLLDVRYQREVDKTGIIPGAVHIPVDMLRERIHELPKDMDIVIYCQVGLRGYIAACMLRQHGFSKVRNVCGGYASYAPAVDALQDNGRYNAGV